jgi:3-vinyl bacteriochlorophyllide hydratase
MPLYTQAERLRRDASPWTLVQGILAPIQFLVFLVSAVLVIRFLMTGNGFAAATISVLIKTLVLYTIMITGCIWERAVFGRYLFAAAFFWEDFVSMFVLALHTLYVGALLFGSLHARYQMYIALLAYSAYLLNATQFVIKLRKARLEGVAPSPAGSPDDAPAGGAVLT